MNKKKAGLESLCKGVCSLAPRAKPQAACRGTLRARAEIASGLFGRIAGGVVVDVHFACGGGCFAGGRRQNAGGGAVCGGDERRELV